MDVSDYEIVVIIERPLNKKKKKHKSLFSHNENTSKTSHTAKQVVKGYRLISLFVSVFSTFIILNKSKV